MIEHTYRAAALLLVAAMTYTQAAPASAEAAATGGAVIEEEVFVLGKRRAYQGNFEPLENPSAVQVIDNTLLEEVGVLDLNEALDLSASVARQNNFGGLWNSFSIRGFQGDINVPSGFLVNGFNAGRGFGGPRDIVGIESVEVLKGPRSALFGRGEPGGTINLVTKRPQFEKGGYVRGVIGSWDQYRLEGDVQTTFGSDDNVGFRFVGFYEDAESFRRTVETERLGLYPSITWDVSDRTSLTYELEYTTQEIPMDRGVAFTEEFGFTPRRTFVGEPGDGPIETEVIGHQFEIQHNFSESWSLLGGIGYRETSLEGDASETNFGGRQTLVADGQTLSRFFRSRDFESEYSVFRAELAGDFNTGSLRHRLLVGADYDKFTPDTFILRFRPPGGVNADTDLDTLDPATYLFLDVFDPVYGQWPQPEPGPNTDREEEFEGFGIYFQDQIDITERFQLRLGGRYDDVEQSVTNLRADPITTNSRSDSRFSPQLGAVYFINDGFSLYASYGEGFRQQTNVDFQGNLLDPNVTESGEIGFKLDVQDFANGASGLLTVALFQVDQSNITVNETRPFAVESPGCGGFCSRAAGEARSRGIEVDASVSWDMGLSLWFSYAYTDAEFTSDSADPDFGFSIEKGDPLINAPEHQLNIQVNQSFTLAGMPTQVGGGIQYTDERLGWTGADFFLPSYTTVRLSGQIDPIENLTLRLDVDNLLDETFYTNSFADVWVQPGTPQRFRLSAVYSF